MKRLGEVRRLIREASWCAVSVVLIAACGGPGPDNQAAAPPALMQAPPGGALAERTPPARPFPEEPATTVSGALPQAAERQAESAERDLGLVDWDRGVRIATASGDQGLLDPAQLGIALLDTNPSVRRSAVDGLGDHLPAVRRAFLPELAAALEDPDEAVRESAVELLADIDDPRALALLRRATLDESPLVRDEAAAVLRAIGRRSAP